MFFWNIEYYGSSRGICNITALLVAYRILRRGDGGWAKKEIIFLVPSPKKNPVLAGWLQRIRLIRATPWDDFAVIGDQFWSTNTAIFPCVAVSYKNWSIFRIIADYCRPQKRPSIWIRVQLFWAFGPFEPQHRFLYQRIEQSWFATILFLLSPHPLITALFVEYGTLRLLLWNTEY